MPIFNLSAISQLSSLSLNDIKKTYPNDSAYTHEEVLEFDFELSQCYTSLSIEQELVSHYRLYAYYKEQYDYLNALNQINLTALKVETLNNNSFSGHIYLEKSSTEIKLQNYNESELSMEEGLAYFLAAGDSEMVCISMSQLGTAKINNGYTQEGFELLKEASNILAPNMSNHIAYFINSNLSAYYLSIGEADSGLIYLDFNSAILRSQSDPISHAEYYGNMAYAYLLKNDNNSSLSYFDSSFALANKLNQPSFKMTLYKDRSELYKQMGAHSKSLQDLERHMTLKDSIENIVNLEQYKDWGIAMVNLEKNRELAQEKLKVLKLNHKSKFQTLFNYFVFLGFLALFLISLLIFWRFRTKMTKKRELIRKDLELEKRDSQLKNLAIEKQEMLNQNLNKELAYKKNDLTKLTLDMARRNEFAQKVIELIKQIPDIVSDAGLARKKELIMYLSQHQYMNQNLVDLHENIILINQEFVEKLCEVYPSLTKSDIELCSYYKIGLNSKDIASIRGIEAKSVDMGRYRLRKKLNLTAEEDLYKFLVKI